MSNSSNVDIIERAYEALDEAVGTSWGGQLEEELDYFKNGAGDLDRIRTLTSEIERHLTYMLIINDSEIA